MSNFKLTQNALRRAAEYLYPAIDNESSRYALGGVQVTANGPSEVELMATDGRRAHRVIIALAGGEPPEEPVYIPLETLKALRKLPMSAGRKLALFCKGWVKVARGRDGRKAERLPLVGTDEWGRFPLLAEFFRSTPMPGAWEIEGDARKLAFWFEPRDGVQLASQPDGASPLCGNLTRPDVRGVKQCGGPVQFYVDPHFMVNALDWFAADPCRIVAESADSAIRVFHPTVAGATPSAVVMPMHLDPNAENLLDYCRIGR